MNGFLRYLTTVALAALITLSAFYLMHRLIDNDGVAPVSPEAVTVIRFGPVDIPEAPKPPDRTPPPKPDKRQPPPQTEIVHNSQPIDRPVDIERTLRPGRDGHPVLVGGFEPMGRSDSGEARPVAAMPPPYPREAALEGIEGWVRIAVEIDERGRVRDVEVLAAEPRGYFEQAAIRAVQRWSWKPAMIDGQPRAQRVIQELTFDLDDV
jgi:protein TonB